MLDSSMLQQLGAEHEFAFLKMMMDYQRASDKSLQFISPESGDADGEWTSLRFRQLVKEVELAKCDWRPKAGKISLTRYVWPAAEGVIQAQALLRFPLDDVSELDGGNLVVSVPPSLRRHGFGGYCMALLLFEAVRAGLRRALVTCPAQDIAARRMCEKNRGQFLDQVTSTHPSRAGLQIARYWISFT